MFRTSQLGTCNCDYGYPCEFNAPPTRVPCEGVMAMEIIDGYFGDIRHDGFEFREAEMASATFSAGGEMEQNYSKRFAAITYMSYGPSGIIPHESFPVRRD